MSTNENGVEVRRVAVEETELRAAFAEIDRHGVSIAVDTKGRGYLFVSGGAAIEKMMGRVVAAKLMDASDPGVKTGFVLCCVGVLSPLSTEVWRVAQHPDENHQAVPS